MGIGFFKRVVFTLGVLWTTLAMASPSTILLYDNFNCENNGQGAFEYNEFANWNVTNGNIALIGNDFFDIYPHNGLYLDLGGSFYNTPGTLTSKTKFTLKPDTSYILSFDLGGNPYDSYSTNTVEVTLGSAFTESFTLDNSPPQMKRITRVIHVDSTITEALKFSDVGSKGSDSEGLILDNVSLIAAPDGCESCMVGTVTADPNLLWPPNHKMRPVTVSYSTLGDCEEGLSCQITSVTSNEPEIGHGTGNKAPDWVITGDLTVDLRAERSGKGRGRVYTIALTCTDAVQNISTGTVNVTVPHDKRKKPH